MFQLGGTCRRGGRCLLVVPVRVIQTRFGFLIAWRLPCFLASSRHWYNVRRGVARWQTFTRRAGVASCNTIGEQHFLLGRRFVLRSRRVSFESTFTHALATGECWRDDAWACRLRQLSIVERGFPIYPSMQNLLQRRYNGQVARRRQSRQSPNLNPRALRVGVTCCARCATHTIASVSQPQPTCAEGWCFLLCPPALGRCVVSACSHPCCVS